MEREEGFAGEASSAPRSGVGFGVCGTAAVPNRVEMPPGGWTGTDSSPAANFPGILNCRWSVFGTEKELGCRLLQTNGESTARRREPVCPNLPLPPPLVGGQSPKNCFFL